MEMMDEQERFENGVVPRDLGIELVKKLAAAAELANKLAAESGDIWE